MKQQLKTVDYKWLTEPTGDPFADAGGYALKEFSERFPEKDILELIEEVTRIYVDCWGGGLNAFFLNSKITQPAYKPKQKIEETRKYFREMVDEKNAMDEGYCRISGRKAKLFTAGRDNSILSGSGTFINFHHAFESGLSVSKEMLIRFHFVPLASVLVQGRIAVIHSNENFLTEFFARENCRANLRAVAMNASESMLKSDYRAPATAVFRFIEKVWNDSAGKSCTGSYFLTLYHFTNFGASPEVKIHTVPALLFAFYSFTQRGEVKGDWNRFIAHYYKSAEYKGAKYNDATQTVDFEKKGVVKNIEPAEFQHWLNVIYERLLNNESILPNIRSWSETNRFHLKIVELYLINIRKMKKEAYQKIMQLADFVVENVEKEKIGKCIQQIKNAKSSSGLSRFIVNKIVQENYRLDNPMVITVEEYCEYLFPEEVFWRDVRDVFLIAIYQKLHEKKISVPVPVEEDENDEEYINK